MRRINKTIEILKDPNFIIAIIMSFIFFSFISYLIPRTFTYLIPAEYYYEVESPVALSVLDHHEECKVIELTFERFSRVTGTATIAGEIIQIINDKNEVVKVFQWQRIETGIFEGETTVKDRLELPCEITKGNYYIRGMVLLNINGIQKTHRWTSEDFYID